jgi:hypothetical protein
VSLNTFNAVVGQLFGASGSPGLNQRKTDKPDVLSGLAMIETAFSVLNPAPPGGSSKRQ